MLDGMSMWFGVVAAPFVVGAIGLVMEATVVRRLYTRPLDTLVATFGLSIIIREPIKLTFGQEAATSRCRCRADRRVRHCVSAVPAVPDGASAVVIGAGGVAGRCAPTSV